ncbi:MAG: methyltransferase, partial [bacterium]
VSGNGIFFTPEEICRDFSIAVGDCEGEVVDLCAGIGKLSYIYFQSCQWNSKKPKITAIEKNPRFVEVGKKIISEANWICMDVFDESKWEEQGFKDKHFDLAISNPPFGQIGHQHWREMVNVADLTCVAIAMDKTKYGGFFILPFTSIPWKYSGKNGFTSLESSRWDKIKEKYKNVICNCCSFDLSLYENKWQGASPKVELAYIAIQ